MTKMQMLATAGVVPRYVDCHTGGTHFHGPLAAPPQQSMEPEPEEPETMMMTIPNGPAFLAPPKVPCGTLTH